MGTAQVITLAHGAGGVEGSLALAKLFFNRLEERLKRTEGGVGIDFPDDSAAIKVGDDEYVVVTVDSYTVKPITFPGGDIGSLAAAGSINDVLMLGGIPVAMLDSIVVEEGFSWELLERITESFLVVLREEGIPLIGGDFKVMPKGQLDGIVISTVGIGRAKELILDKNIRPGDKIIVTGYLGDHGATILSLQQGIDLAESPLKSDIKPLTTVMKPLVEKYPGHIHAARDPTRGGLAMVLNDWAKASGTIIAVEEGQLPIRPEVQAYCSMLGMDPTYLANEGVAVLGVEGSMAEEMLDFVKGLGCSEAKIIGEVRRSEEYKGLVLLRSVVGGYRILEPPTGELVPRIC